MGLPKCASTSLQCALHACEQIDFGGLLPVSEAGKFWQTNALSDLFDCELRFNAYNLDKSLTVMNEYVQNSSKSKIVFSSENISLRFLPWDVPTWHKLHFVRSLFPATTRYLFVYKSPHKMLISLYKEWVLLGYASSFAVFCMELFKLRQFSFFNDILLGSFLRAFDSILPRESLTIVYADNSSFESDASQFFGDKITLPKQAKNVSISDDECRSVVDFNLRQNDYNGFFDLLELHRINRDWEDQQKYSNARKRKIRKLIGSLLAQYTTPLNDAFKLPHVVADVIGKDLVTLQAAHDPRINGQKLEAYIAEMTSLAG